MNTPHKPSSEESCEEEKNIPQPSASASTVQQKKQKPEDDLKQRCEEYLAGWQRARADYQNLQKETERRITDTMKYATEGFLLELLPLVDHFMYAFKGMNEVERQSNWVKGFEHIQSNFLKVLEHHGLEMIPTVGEHFNTELHEAVEQVEGGESGIIAEEVSAGFMLNGKVIKPARVKIFT